MLLTREETQAAIEQLRYQPIPVLDKGHVMLIDAMGSDSAICEAARVSYGAGTKKSSDDEALIRYLMRHRHTTPFEMVEFKFRVRVPMDCWRQWIRHRTASVNEYSTRYSEAIQDKQRTSEDEWRLQSKTNRQGSAEDVESWPDDFDLEQVSDNFKIRPPGAWLTHRESHLHLMAENIYEERLKLGVAREQARKDLPLSTYTEAYWKIDLHNLFHFLGLRMDSHAQQEISSYAWAIGESIVSRVVPVSWRAFRDYHLDALTLSRLDAETLKTLLLSRGSFTVEEFMGAQHAMWSGKTKCRERDECFEKFRRLGVIR